MGYRLIQGGGGGCLRSVRRALMCVSFPWQISRQFGPRGALAKKNALGVVIPLSKNDLATMSVSSGRMRYLGIFCRSSLPSQCILFHGSDWVTEFQALLIF